MIVYLIENLINGHKYVGQTRRSLTERWKSHCSPSQKYCRVLHNAILKYGTQAFKLSTLATTYSQAVLDVLEKKFIKELNCRVPHGYNLMEGGNGGCHSETTKKKMSESRSGKPKTGCMAKGILRGPRDPAIGLRISRAKKGRPNGLLGTTRPYIPHMIRRKPVVYVSDAGVQCTFSGIMEAAKTLKIGHQNIVAVLKGRRHKAGGYRWKYISTVVNTKKEENV